MRLPTTPVTAALGAVLVLLLGGCGGAKAPAADLSAAASSASSAASPDVAPSAPVPVISGGGRYATPEAILTALRAGGLRCEQAQDGSFPDVSAAKSCVLGGTEDVVLLVFASTDERANYLAAKEPLASVVVGENWAVQTVLSPTADTVAKALGGTVVVGAG